MGGVGGGQGKDNTMTRVQPLTFTEKPAETGDSKEQAVLLTEQTPT